jgi:hypothetical protein
MIHWGSNDRSLALRGTGGLLRDTARHQDTTQYLFDVFSQQSTAGSLEPQNLEPTDRNAVISYE